MATKTCFFQTFVLLGLVISTGQVSWGEESDKEDPLRSTAIAPPNTRALSSAIGGAYFVNKELWARHEALKSRLAQIQKDISLGNATSRSALDTLDAIQSESKLLQEELEQKKVLVSAAETGSGNSITGDTRYSYKTDADGKFTMKLPASKKALYNLVAHDGKYREWRTWANGVGEPLRTTPGQTIENVVLRLTQPATVRGRVTNALGTPRAHVKVRAAALDKLANRYYLPETETDAEGRYELRFIRPGSNAIQIKPFWLSAENAASSTSKIVDLKSGDVKSDVNFRVDARE